MDFPEMNEEPTPDKIFSEAQASREALAAQFDCDVDPLYEEVERRERVSGRERVASAPKRLSPVASE